MMCCVSTDLRSIYVFIFKNRNCKYPWTYGEMFIINNCFKKFDVNIMILNSNIKNIKKFEKDIINNKYNCICGFITNNLSYIKNHFKTKKHIDYISNNNL